MPTQTSGSISIGNIYDHWGTYSQARSHSLSFYRGATVYNIYGTARVLPSTSLSLSNFYNSYPIDPSPPPPPPPGDGGGGGGP